MMVSTKAVKPNLELLKRNLAKTLVRSGLDYTDQILILNAFLKDFRWRSNVDANLIRIYWDNLLKAPPACRHSFSLYIHVPYCVKKCHFCYCSVKASPSAVALNSYVPQLEKEMAFFSPTFRKTSFRLFHVGGGTPSLIAADDLSKLLKSARRHFLFDSDCFRSVEFNPASTDEAKLKVAREAGFHRVSFGVQSMAPAVLKRQNRERQTLAMIRQAVKAAKNVGFESVNIDLILGLEGETEESFAKGLNDLAALRPDSIMVTALSITAAYLKVTRTTQEQALKHRDNLIAKSLSVMEKFCKENEFVCDNFSPTRGEWILYSREIDRHTSNFMRGNEGRSLFRMSVLGIGPLAWSHAFGQALYERGPEGFQSDKTLYKAAPMTFKEEMMRYIIYSLAKSSKISFRDFEEKFGCHFLSAFALESKALKALRQIKINDHSVEFLPRQDSRRIFYGLFFLMDSILALPVSAVSSYENMRMALERELRDISLE